MVYIDTNRSNTHADPLLGSRWAQLWVHILVIFTGICYQGQHIIGEGAAIFTDMTETMLTTLDQQMALSSEAQKPEGSLTIS